MLVEILYRDKQDWNSKKSKATNWTNYATKYKSERIQPSFLAPETVTDTWNAAEHDVQVIKSDTYEFQMNSKESELDSFAVIKACSDIVIVQYVEDSFGVNLSDSYIVDMTKSEWFEIETVRAADTSGYIVTIKFRTDRTVINKTGPYDFTNNITFDKGTSAWELGFVGTIPGKLSAFDNNSIISLYLSTLQKYVRSGFAWVTEGDPLTIIGLGTENDVATLDDNNVAVIGDGQGLLSKYTYSGGVWSLVGNVFNAAGSYLTPSICRLTANQIALYDTLTQDLATLNFDGTDWSQIGNALNVVTTGSVYIDYLTSTKIAMFDMTAAIRDYDWDGIDWAANQNIFFSSVGEGAICRLSSSRVATYTENSGNLRSYTLTSDWAADAGTLNVGGTGSTLAGLSSNEVFLTATTSGNYNYGIETYYSDFDALVYNKDTEPTLVEWSDGTQKAAQTVDKSGLEYLQYIDIDDHALFIQQLKESSIVNINGTSVTEIEIEKNQIAEDLMRIVVRGVSTVTQSTLDLGVDQTNKLELIHGVTDTYYTDFALQDAERAIEILDIDWFDGTKKRAQTIDKPSTAFTLFLDNDDLNTIITSIKLAVTVEVNDVAKTEIEYVVEQVTTSLNKIVVTVVNSVTVTDFNLTPNQDYNINIDTGAEIYHTDYKPKLISETPVINSTTNQTGVNTPSKTITKTVKEVKFFMNEVDAFDLKNKFELFGTVLLNVVSPPSSETVLEVRDVAPVQIGVDLYEVVVVCFVNAEIGV